MQQASNVFIARFESQKAYLREDESFHCCKVLRKKAGDRVLLIDGQGLYREALLEKVSEKLCVAGLVGEEKLQKPRSYSLHLAIAPTKHMDRLEWLVEKAVEIGIDELSFIRCQHSERTQVNTERLKKIAESAVKQSLQARIPVLHDLQDLLPFMQSQQTAHKYIAHCENGSKTHIRDIRFSGTDTLVLIGPEGDFSKEEIHAAISQGYKALHLGENRLRTETAGLMVVQAAFLAG